MKPINPLHQQVEHTVDAVDTAMMIAVEELSSSDTLLAAIARAHVAAIKTEMIIHAIDVPNDQPRLYADEVKPKALPALKPVPGGKTRDGIKAKLRTALDFECPTCHAVKGETCFRMTKPGWNGEPTGERKAPDASHQKRFALSRAYNDKARAAYDREHFTSEVQP